MKLSESVKPISYVKAHASEIIRRIATEGKTLIITQNGEAKAVLQDIREYEEIQESLALLKILAQGSKSLDEGRIKPVGQAFKDIREKIAKP